MIDVQRPLFHMPSTLGVDHLPHGNSYHLPQLKQFDLNWAKPQLSRGGERENQREWPSMYSGESEVRQSRPNSHVSDMPHAINPQNPYSPPLPIMENQVRQQGTISDAPQYIRPVHARQNSRSGRTQPFYQSYYSARPQSPLPKKEIQPERLPSAGRRLSETSNSIASYLQIPASINSSKGSLPEFAAQVCRMAQN